MAVWFHDEIVKDVIENSKFWKLEDADWITMAKNFDL